MPDLYGLEWVAHHGDEHVDQHDGDGHLVDGKEDLTHTVHHERAGLWNKGATVHIDSGDT